MHVFAFNFYVPADTEATLMQRCAYNYMEVDTLFPIQHLSYFDIINPDVRAIPHNHYYALCQEVFATSGLSQPDYNFPETLLLRYVFAAGPYTERGAEAIAPPGWTNYFKIM